jgi:hypothetical protein
VGPLAQLVEQLTFNQRVAGSIPARLTIFPTQLHFFSGHTLFSFFLVSLPFIGAIEISS